MLTSRQINDDERALDLIFWINFARNDLEDSRPVSHLIFLISC